MHCHPRNIHQHKINNYSVLYMYGMGLCMYDISRMIGLGRLRMGIRAHRCGRICRNLGHIIICRRLVGGSRVSGIGCSRLRLCMMNIVILYTVVPIP